MNQHFFDCKRRIWSIARVRSTAGNFLTLTPPEGEAVELRAAGADDPAAAGAAGFDEIDDQPPAYEDVVQPELLDAGDAQLLPGALPTVELSHHAATLLIDDPAEEVTLVNQEVSQILLVDDPAGGVTATNQGVSQILLVDDPDQEVTAVGSEISEMLARSPLAQPADSPARFRARGKRSP